MTEPAMNEMPSSDETSRTLQTLYLAAGCYNFLIVVFSKFFSADLGLVDPLFSQEGCILIVLWGMAYASVADRIALCPSLSLVFSMEKLFFGWRWMNWMHDNHALKLPLLLKEDPFTGVFFAVYGMGDIAASLLFLHAAIKHRGIYNQNVRRRNHKKL